MVRISTHTGLCVLAIVLAVYPVSGQIRLSGFSVSSLSGKTAGGSFSSEVAVSSLASDGSSSMAFGFWNQVAGVVPTEVEPESVSIPLEFRLMQNYPNPFRTRAHIRFDVPSPEAVRLDIYDVTGREIATLLDKPLVAGSYEAIWLPSGMPSGIYFYRIQCGNRSEVRSMVLLN